VPPGGTHEITQSVDPCCRVVYTDTDPLVLGRVRALAAPGPGLVTCVSGDIADVDALLAGAAPLFDPSRPVGLLLMSTLAHVPTTIAAARAVRSLMAALPPGSHVVIYHLASDLDPAMPAAARLWNKTVPVPITLRSRADVLTLVAGLDLVPPGAVPVTEWRPEQQPPAEQIPVHGVVARKP
jgi:hypothetical protein